MDKATSEKLAMHFFSQLRPNVSNPKLKIDWFTSVQATIEEFGEKGVTPLEIFERIIDVKETLKGSTVYPGELFSKEELSRKQNLIKPEKEYYHRELKVFYDPIRYIDEKGQIQYDMSTYKEPTIREFFSVEDLLDYFYRGCRASKENRSRDRGIMRFLLEQYSLDEILYTIDVVSEEYSKPIYSANILQTFLDRGMERFEMSRDMQIQIREDRLRDEREERRNQLMHLSTNGLVLENMEVSNEQENC